jgi:hypothetical protein
MPRRQSNTSGRRPRKTNGRRLPLNKQQSTHIQGTDANDPDIEEISVIENSEGRHEDIGTPPTDAALIVLDQSDDTAAQSLGNRRRYEKNSTPQRGLNKKKARFDLTSETSESEEEIVFEDCLSTGSSKNSFDSPPAPRRICPEQAEQTMPDDSSSVSSPADTEPTPTLAETIRRDTRPMQPAAPNIQKSCRFSAQLLVPPVEEPVKTACELLQKVFAEIQKQAGRQVWISSWHAREDNLICKRPKDIPIGTTSDDRDIYTRLFDNYFSLSPNIEKRLYLKIHFTTQSPDALHIPLKDLGQRLQMLKDQFGFRLNPNPNPCQSAKIATIGWCYGSVKTMDSDKLVSAVRVFLKIPSHIALGAQWRTITTEHGKKYPWPDDPNAPRPPQAMHFDIDDAYIGAWYPKFAKLWKKGATKKLNYLQLRLIPCFTTQVGRTLTPVQHKSTVYMASKQAYFINVHTTKLTNSSIMFLDEPIGDTNMTLRRYLMMKAPEGLITDRIFISVDQAYRGTDFVMAVPKVYADQAVRVLHNMIPECLYLYGAEAGKWFTSIGLVAYQDVKWDPLLNATTSINDDDAAALVDEKLFGMGNEWKEAMLPEPVPTTATQIEDINQVHNSTVGEVLAARARRGIHDDTSSFGDAFGRSHSGSTIAPPRSRRVGFRDDHATENPSPTNDDATVSTMGTEATTGSTRRTLRHQVEINNALRTEGAQIAEDRDRLQVLLDRLQQQMRQHGLNPSTDDITINTSSTPNQPSAIRVPPSTDADSAGGKN